MKVSKSFFVFFATLTFYLAVWLFTRDALNIPTDAKSFYLPVSENLAAGKGYVVDADFSYRYPPVLPLILAFCHWVSNFAGSPMTIYGLLICILQSISCMLVYNMGARLANSFTGILGSVAFATYPFMVVATTTQYALNHTVIFTFFFILFFYSFILAHVKNSFIFFSLSGLALMLSALTWPSSAYLIVLCLPYILLKSMRESFVQKIAYCFCFLLGFMPLLLLWQGVVFQKTGQTELLSTGKMNSMRDGLRRYPGSKFDQFKFVQLAREEERRGGLLTTGEVIKFYMNQLSQNPKDTVQYVFFKAARPWYATDSEKREGLVLLIQLPYLILGFIGMFVSFKKQMPYRWFLVLVILYFWLVTFSVLSILRYMVPVMFLWMFFVALGIGSISDKVKQKLLSA